MDVLSFFGFGSKPEIDITFENQDTRKTVTVHTDKGAQKLLVYNENDEVKGTIKIRTPGKLEHTGIKVEFIGEIELVYDRGNHYDFTSMVVKLAEPGELNGESNYDFVFRDTQKQHESYNGINCRLRYYIRVTITRKFAADIVKEQDIWVQNYGEPPGAHYSTRMEVGIEDCLHIEFEFARTKFHLKDVILGRIYFRLVRLKIKFMELCLQKVEATGTAPNVYREQETLTKYEIMDGVPVKGEVIPVRLYLGAFDLTPTYRSVHSKFSVKYLINMVLVDEDDRRYFKQTDVTLWRQHPDTIEDKMSFLQLDYVPNPEKKRKKKKRRDRKQDSTAEQTTDGQPTDGLQDKN